MSTTRVLLAWGGLLSSALALRAIAPEASHDITFEVRTAPGKLGSGTLDQITIVFSNSPADAPSPPRPILGTDVIEEFSLSGQDLVGNEPFKFTRRVRDLSFLEAKYVRVVNLGNDGWAGDYLSMWVDGRPILDRQSLYPRKPGKGENGIEKFNRGRWFERSFWQGELQILRRDRYLRAK
jgi:hypothetical protein